MIFVLITNPNEVITASFHEWGIYLEFLQCSWLDVGLVVLVD